MQAERKGVITKPSKTLGNNDRLYKKMSRPQNE